MVNEFEIKKQLCDIGKRIYNRNMVADTSSDVTDLFFDFKFVYHAYFPPKAVWFAVPWRRLG